LNGSLSVRFDSVLGEDERAEVVTRLNSHGARLASWKPHQGAVRTYARAEYRGASPAQALSASFPGARVDDPPLVVIEVVPDDPESLGALLLALAGPAAPAGIVAALAAGPAIVVELDDTQTSLALVVDLVDVELALGAPGRRIHPLIGLSDRTLARFAGALLATPQLDETRLVETYAEPLLGEASV
jgi:hypothetical protein